MLAAIDLRGCDFAALAAPPTIRALVSAVIDAIGVTGHGPAASERFGDIDKTFPFDQTLEALVYVEQGHANGKVVTTLD